MEKLHVDLGQYVTAGTPVASVYDTSAVEVRIPLTDRQLAILQLPLGRSAARGPAVDITATVAGQAHSWSGFITRTDASVDTRSRMYYAIAEVENPFGTDEAPVHLPLMPGLFVTAEIAGKTLDDLIVLPRGALVRRGIIYTLDEENRVQSEAVEVLKKSDHAVWLRAAVADGVPIVLEKHALLSPGTRVDPVFEAAPEAGGSTSSGSPSE